MIWVLEVDPRSETVYRRRMFLGSVVYAMLKTNGLSYFRHNEMEYIKI